MVTRPKIETPEQAHAYAIEKLDARHGYGYEAQVLWYVEGSAWWIGVKDGSERSIYVVGPRGAFNRWVHLSTEEAAWVREWL